MAWGVNPNDGTSHTTTARLTGNGTDWPVQTYRTGVVSDTQQARVAFKLSQTGSGAVVALESSDAANYIGVYENQGTLYLRTRVGASFTNQLTLLSGLDTTAWYVLEVAADEAAGFRVSVWKEGAEGARYEARYEMPRGLPWRFHAWAYKGVLTLDGPIASGAYKEERQPSLSPTPLFSEGFAASSTNWSTSGTVAWNVNPNDGTFHTSTVRATGASSWTPVIARTASVCFCQAKTEPFAGRKESHLGQLVKPVMLEKSAI
ncbi:MAG: hypothetical protein U0768_08030 [Anaerolineae bacterium]